ncbi:MAG TPA: hypothetical protein PK431_02595 [Chitinophagales bacterium]|nr:hypothetical protein [Chitinophagales bacterium]
MTDTFTIDFGQKLPTKGDLLNIFETYKQVTIHYETLPNDYVFNLSYSFPDKAVYDRKWDKTIFISPSIHNDKILQKKLELYECAKAFRQDANFLMGLMADTFEINLQTLDGLHELKHKKSEKQRGKLNEYWNYYLHGAECQFENVKTKQVVEVIVVTKPEFGYLDCYFFYNYMSTTERFKELAAFFDNDYLNICKAIDFLVLERILTRVNDLFIQRNIIAL